MASGYTFVSRPNVVAGAASGKDDSNRTVPAAPDARPTSQGRPAGGPDWLRVAALPSSPNAAPHG